MRNVFTSEIYHFLIFNFLLCFGYTKTQDILIPEIISPLQETLVSNALTELPGIGTARSFDNLTFWAGKEEIIFDLCKSRLPKLREELKTLKSYILEYEDELNPFMLNSKKPFGTFRTRAQFVASSAIASYKMTCRYFHRLQNIKELIAFNYLKADLIDVLWNKETPGNQNEFKSSKRGAGGIPPNWPNKFDISYAMQGLVQIQEVYNYDYEKLPFVLCPESSQPAGLNAFHSAQLGLHGLYKKYFTVAIEWVEFATRNVNTSADQSMSLSSLENYLELATKAHNRKFKKATETPTSNKDYLFVPAVKLFENPAVTNRKRLSEIRLNLHGGRKERIFTLMNFSGLCSGMNFQTPKERAALFCWLDKSSSPARIILPYKTELLSAQPDVIQVYDFIGEKAISKMLSMAKDCLSESTLFGGSYFHLTRTRTPTSCDIPNRDLPEFEKKVRILTLADISETGASENTQIVEYTPGAYFNPHVDVFFGSENLTEIEKEAVAGKCGDRYISIIVYLNDVPGGGITPFPSAGTAAVPVKGSVVLWKNLFRNGTSNYDSVHGSCPVTYGRKQIISKFIRYNPQFQKIPCTLNKND